MQYAVRTLFGFLGWRARHSEVHVAVVVRFASTGDGNNHQQRAPPSHEPIHNTIAVPYACGLFLFWMLIGACNLNLMLRPIHVFGPAEPAILRPRHRRWHATAVGGSRGPWGQAERQSALLERDPRDHQLQRRCGGGAVVEV